MNKDCEAAKLSVNCKVSQTKLKQSNITESFSYREQHRLTVDQQPQSFDEKINHVIWKN